MLIWFVLTSILIPSLKAQEPDRVPGDHCNRRCTRFNAHKTCYFKFEMHVANTSSNLQGCKDCILTDGRKTIAIVLNNQLPGPPITVCHEDTIIVDVTNKLLEPADIHWHGLHQRDTPWMDGTQYITQYPIQPQETIRYRFLADLPGTFFYHSHFADQRALGAFGPMIIRSIKDPAERLYDVDTHIMFLNDWVYDGDIYLVKNILIDGLGQRQNGTEKPVFKEYSVKRGHRYRFRVIYSSATNCTLDISVDNHMLKVISSDSFAIKPITAESIGITSGERFDFILDANQNVGNYWIRIQGNYACGGMIQGAVLRYEGSKGFPNVTDLNVHKELKGVQVNPTVNDRNEKDIPLVEAKSLKPWSPSSIYPTYYLNVTMEDKGMGNFDFFINRIYYEAETRFSLLQVKDAISYSDYYCNLTNFESNGTDCSKTTCKCPHLIDVPCKRYVEFFFFNPSDDVHPMHFHGYDLRVVGFGRLDNVSNIEEIKQMDAENPFPRNYNYPPQKDNMQVPTLGGYAILQMYTDNPGFWALHCHVGAHSQLGMFSILKVCDAKDMKKVPEFAYCPK